MVKGMFSVSPAARCKCCDGPSALCGVVDLSRGGADHAAGKKVDPYSGVPIYYYRCERCGFTFTSALDDWTSAQFSEHIYNADYVRQDPDYVFARPDENARTIAEKFSALAKMKILDYGSGSGVLEQQLRLRDFHDVRSYDPFHSSSDPSVLQEQFRVVFAFEVFEHSVDPRQLMQTLAALLDDDGAMLVSTLFVPDNTASEGIDKWWYCMPRNGHVSFFTPTSLSLLASQYGLKAASFNSGFHLLFRSEKPDWAKPYEFMTSPD